MTVIDTRRGCLMNDGRGGLSYWLTVVAVIWGGALATYVTVAVFTDPPDVGIGTATAYATAVGIPSAAVAWYKWARRDR